MFSSNQVLSISCPDKHLEQTLRYVLDFADYDPKGKIALGYQFTKDHRICIGLISTIEKSRWKPFMYERPDIDFIAAAIRNYIRQYPAKSDFDGDDGAVNQGYLFEVIPESFAEEENGVKQPFYGLFSVQPFACFYSK